MGWKSRDTVPLMLQHHVSLLDELGLSAASTETDKIVRVCTLLVPAL